MMDQFLAKLGDRALPAVLLASIGCAATVLLAFVPFLQKDNIARRIKAVSVERERIRMRERERLAGQQNVSKAQLALQAGGMTKQIVDTLQSQQLAQHRHRQAEAGDGRLPRRRARKTRSSTFRLVRADRFLPGRAGLCVLHRPFAMVADDEVRVSMGVRLSRHQGAGDLPQQQDQQAPEDDEPRLSQHGRPAHHLRRIGHVDRALGAQGQPGNRHRKHRTGRGDCRCSPPKCPISRTGATRSRTSPTAPA